MRCARTSTYVFMALAGALACASSPACSVDKSPTPDGRQPQPVDAGMDGGDGSVDGGMDSGAPPASLLEGDSVARIGSLTLAKPVEAVELAGQHALALHDESGVTMLDLRDPRMPKALAEVVTAGRAVAVRYDHARQVVFLLTEGGELQALRVTDPAAPVPIGQTQLVQVDSPYRDLARAGNRLFALTAEQIIPINAAFGEGDVTLTALDPVSTGEGSAERIAASGTGLYVALGGGVVRSFSASSAPRVVDEVDLGGEIRGWSVRGQRLWVALEGIGVRALWLRPGEPIVVELRAGELDDADRLARSGQLLATALGRGQIALVDVSITSRPRGIAVHETDLPDWIAVAGGNLLYGSGNELHVVGVPPFLESGVPASVQDDAPRHGRTELRFSKPLDPDTVTLESVTLRCDGRLVPAIPHLDIDGANVAVLPTAELPMGGQCTFRLRGLRDTLGLAASATPDWLTFTANDRIEGFVHNGPSAEKHTAEGRMTGWSRDAEGGFEYADIAPARGATGELYVDFDGERMWLFFDAFEQRDVLYADCAATLSGFVASGETRFSASVFGDQRIETENIEAIGGYAYAGTQGLRAPHATFELALEAPSGGFALQVYLPSMSRGCEHAVAEPIVFAGMCDETGCTVDGRGAVDAPATPTRIGPLETVDDTPTIQFNISNALMSLPRARVELLTLVPQDGGEPARTVFRAETLSNSLTIPAGALERGKSFEVRVTAFNIADTSPTATATLTLLEE